MENEKAVLDYGSRTLTTGKAKHAGNKPKSAKVIPPDYIEWLPDALAAACCHSGKYALGLSDGTILFFDQAEYVPESEWIHLYTASGLKNFPWAMGNGIELRLSNVTWAADVAVGNK